MRKVEATYAALTRQTLDVTIEVEDDATDGDIEQALEDNYRDNIDGSEEWQDDNDYWEQGATLWSEVGI